MIRWAALPSALAVSLCAGAASAEGAAPRPWSAGVATTYVVLGDARPTGGMGFVAHGARAFALADRVDARIGAAATIFGLGGEARWLGLLAGPAAGLTVRPAKTLVVGLDVAADLGRVPACNPWGLCARYWGLYPRATLHGALAASDALDLTAALGVRYVSTLGWTGASYEPSLGARVRW